MKKIKIKINRRVKPFSVVIARRILEAVERESKETLEKYRKEFADLVTEFRFKLEEVVGPDKTIKFTVVLVVDDDGRPIKIYAKDIRIVETIVKPLDIKVEVSI
jgi:hypothetical protein